MNPVPTVESRPKSPPKSPKISRRRFLATSGVAGGALVLGLTLHGPFRFGRSNHHANNPNDPFDAWIRIYPDGRVQLVLNKSEMGQGVYTALPMILAEEANLDWERISVVQSDDSVGTGGSSSVYKSYTPLRQAGAAVRETMIAVAVDCGQVINMNGLRAQIEGGILFGLSAALKERITVKDGAIQQQNFSDYDPLRISEAPHLETYIVESDRGPGGIGEPPVALVGPSVGNAIFAATGKRLRRLPFQLDHTSV